MSHDADLPDTPWAQSETELLAHVEGSINWNAEHSKKAQFRTNLVLTTVLILSVSTPVAVTLSHQLTESCLGVGVYAYAVLAPVIVAVLEGLRRVLHFEDHWHESHTMMETLIKMCRRYRDAQISHAAGSEAWIENYILFRNELEAIFTSHTTRYFEIVRRSDEHLKAHLETEVPSAKPVT